MPRPPDELDDQTIRIENAREQIRLDGIELDNLHKEIAIEVSRTETLQGLNRRLAQIQVNFIDGPIADTISVFLQDTSLGAPAPPSISDDFSSSRFGDRSVATSEWMLSVPLTGRYANVPEELNDITIFFNHRFYARE